ncbi:MAG: hypothetical protein ACM3NN_12990 [Nitrospirota bacterium]|jgi:hypothetical protein
MKTTLLLTEEAETTKLMLKDVAFEDLRVRDSEAHASRNCDRWGHPCPGSRPPPHHTRRGDPGFIASRTVT